MGCINPGLVFLQRYGPAESADDVLRYVAFLREESDVGLEPPVDLARIYARFGIPTPRYASLPNQQGLLLSPEHGMIIINEDDSPVRQRFTEAHELIEFLFCTYPHSGWVARRVGPFQSNTKERLCDAGAAELLMPRSSFAPRVCSAGVSYETARQLAIEYRVSTTAALVQMVRLGLGQHAVVLWRMKNKPTEIRNRVPDAQLTLFGEPPRRIAQEKLRVEWSLSGPRASFIPKDKSISEDTSIYAAWRDDRFTIGEDSLNLGKCAGIFRCESKPFQVEEERQVLSLLHLPGDEGCSGHSGTTKQHDTE